MNFLIEEKRRRFKREADPLEIRADTCSKWVDTWNAENGSVWFKTLIRDLPERLYRRHGQVHFYLTQFFTSHGVFGSYLHGFKIRQDPYYPHCRNVVIDSPEHTFFYCPRFTAERLQVESILDAPFCQEYVV